jgi:hypothetical protein
MLMKATPRGLDNSCSPGVILTRERGLESLNTFILRVSVRGPCRAPRAIFCYQLFALRLRSRMAFLREAPLHLFVVTLRCEHSCPYCQVSRQSADRSRYDMSDETAQRALMIALEPFRPRQDGVSRREPLLNFPLIEKIVTGAASSAAAKAGKKLDFVIASAT